MTCLRVIRLVQRHGLWVVIDGDVDVPAERLLDAGACTAATGEEVDHQLVRERQDELACGHLLDVQMRPPAVPWPF